MADKFAQILICSVLLRGTGTSLRRTDKPGDGQLPLNAPSQDLIHAGMRW